MKNQYINELETGQKINTEFVIRNKAQRTKKNGKKYCLLVLQDKGGFIDGVIWNDSLVDFNDLNEGDFVRIDDGIVSEYRSKKQIEVLSIEKIDNVGSLDRSDFEKTTKKDIKKMLSELIDYINSVKNVYLKKLLDMFFRDRDFLKVFSNATAAVRFHHAYRGGLLEHTLSVLKICDWLSNFYENLDRDLLITGAIFHDIGKIREYKVEIPIKVTDEGKLLGHIIIGYGMIQKKIMKIKNFPPDLKDRLLHIILSHHGHKEFGSPRRPKTLEAFIVYHVDYMDAEIGGFNEVIKENGGKADWSDYLRNFERSLFLKQLDLSKIQEDRSQGTSGDEDLDKLF